MVLLSVRPRRLSVVPETSALGASAGTTPRPIGHSAVELAAERVYLAGEPHGLVDGGELLDQQRILAADWCWSGCPQGVQALERPALAVHHCHGLANLLETSLVDHHLFDFGLGPLAGDRGFGKGGGLLVGPRFRAGRPRHFFFRSRRRFPSKFPILLCCFSD